MYFDFYWGYFCSFFFDFHLNLVFCCSILMHFMSPSVRIDNYVFVFDLNYIERTARNWFKLIIGFVFKLDYTVSPTWKLLFIIQNLLVIFLISYSNFYFIYYFFCFLMRYLKCKSRFTDVIFDIIILALFVLLEFHLDSLLCVRRPVREDYT